MCVCQQGPAWPEHACTQSHAAHMQAQAEGGATGLRLVAVRACVCHHAADAHTRTHTRAYARAHTHTHAAAPGLACRQLARHAPPPPRCTPVAPASHHQRPTCMQGETMRMRMRRRTAPPATCAGATARLLRVASRHPTPCAVPRTAHLCDHPHALQPHCAPYACTPARPPACPAAPRAPPPARPRTRPTCPRPRG